MYIIVILFAVFLIGIPICYSLGIVSTLGLFLVNMDLIVVAQRIYTGVDSITLISIPMFVLSGNLMVKGGMSKRLVDFSDKLIGHFPSGLAMVTILAGVFFAMITGSGIASTAAIGGIMIPIMVKQGYNPEFCGPLVATAGSIGPIIPPSITLLLYGVVAGVSISKLFVGGFLPGILMALSLMVYSYIVGKKRNYIGREKRATIQEIIKSAKDGILALIMPIIIIGGIMSGIFTATESGAIAVFYSLVVGCFIYRELKFKDIFDVFVDSAIATAMTIIIVAFASLFSWLITLNQIPQTLTSFLSENIHSKFMMLVIINIVLLIAGTFLDAISNVVLFAPLFIPLAIEFDIDLVHFGLIMAVNLSIGMCTPPVGVCMFVGNSIAGISMKQSLKDLLPMCVMLIIVLILVTYFPSITLLLPDLFG